jgi:hypothetical protein
MCGVQEMMGRKGAFSWNDIGKFTRIFKHGSEHGASQKYVPDALSLPLVDTFFISLLSLFLKNKRICDHIAVCDPPRLISRIVERENTAAVRQRLGKHVPTAMNTNATTEELVDEVFSVRSMLYQKLNIY